MADRTDIDKLVGSEPENVVPKHQQGTYRNRADDAPMDEKLPEKAMPMRQRTPPFKLTGGGNGG